MPGDAWAGMGASGSPRGCGMATGTTGATQVAGMGQCQGGKYPWKQAPWREHPTGHGNGGYGRSGEGYRRAGACSRGMRPVGPHRGAFPPRGDWGNKGDLDSQGGSFMGSMKAQRGGGRKAPVSWSGPATESIGQEG